MESCIQSQNGIYIFTGHYGSGKTETAVNFALKLRSKSKNSNIALIDLDIVNPFFRSADAKNMLEAEGIRVETPLYANTNVDIPALTGAMGDIIRDENYSVVLDIGGDDLGAKAVGRYSDDILARGSYEQYFVINPYRPFTKSIELASEIYDEIQASAALRCTGIVSNINLLDETVIETVMAGLPLVNSLASLKNVPVSYHAVTAKCAQELINKYPDIFTRDNVITIERTVRRLF